MGRRYWLAATLLALLAIGTQILLWVTRTHADAQTFSGPPRSDYTLTDFTMNALGPEGNLSFTVTGPRLARRGDDGSINVDRPRYVIIDSKGLRWHGTSDAAWVNRAGSVMRMEGHVDMRRDPAPNLETTRIVTSDLTAWLKEKRMQTAAPTQITQPGSILRGIGMKADLDAHTLDLLADVHGSFQKHR
ncbi:MAG: LPS export ABC transporter periplasmic protein LptC [Rhodanobacteraceae bacterium]